METLADLFEEQIKDLYSAEQQLTRALPKMAKAASSDELKEALTNHLEETNEHVSRLEQVAEACGFKPKGKTCAAMKGLIEEGSEAISEDGHPSVIDGAIIAAAQRVEHYEISAYGTAKALAQLLSYDQAFDLLNQTEEEESAADEKLTEVAEQSVYPNAPVDENSMEDEEEKPQAKSKKSSRGRATSRA